MHRKATKRAQRAPIFLLLATALALPACPRAGLPPAEEEETAPQECQSGAKEECYTGPTATRDVGACSSGERSCDESGKWQKCSGEVHPQAESCVASAAEALDLDCDGKLPVVCSEPVVFKTLSKPGIDIGNSLALTAEGNLLWAGVSGPKSGEADAFLEELAPDGAAIWSYDLLSGQGAQQLFRVTESAAKVFAAGVSPAASGGDPDGIALRLTGSGLFEKLTTIASPGSDTIGAMAPAGAAGGVFLAGTVGGPALVSDGGGAFGDQYDLFVMRLPADASAPWIAVCAGELKAPVVRGLVLDEARQRLHVGFALTGLLSVALEPPDNIVQITPMTGDPGDVALITLDPQADAKDAIIDYVVLRSEGQDSLEGIAVDPDGSLYVAGIYSGPELKLGGTHLLDSDPDGMKEGFIARLGTDGKAAWAQRFGGPGNQRLHAVAYANGALYIAGTLDDAGALADAQVPHSGGVDFVVAKLAPETGKVTWLKSAAGAGDEWATALAVEAGGGVWVTGDFSGELSFLGQKATANGDFDAFLFRIPP